MSFFPHPELSTPQGINAIGGDLSVRRLMLAYQYGIFPWFNPDEQILWWHPDPRCVLFPSKVKVARSMRPYFNQKRFRVSLDTAFAEVLQGCRDTYRPGQQGTWLSDDMTRAYTELYELGYAHSVEVWQDDMLVGGLYGVQIEKIFFGESMFSRVSNASKYGLISLCRHLEAEGVHLIDCQINTDHLESIGAEMIPRKVFLQMLRVNRLEWLASQGAASPTSDR